MTQLILPPPVLVLSMDDRMAYEVLAANIVQQTLHAYDRFRFRDGSRVDKKAWRVIKSHENLTVYKMRKQKQRKASWNGPAASPSFDPNMSQSSYKSNIGIAAEEKKEDPEWHLPQLMTVGTMQGSLDDVMYGIVTKPNAFTSALLFKATDSNNARTNAPPNEQDDEILLSEINSPTADDPYRFLGLKCRIDMMWHRTDLMVLEATGMIKHPNTSERMGYLVMHSVHLPTANQSTSTPGPIRGRLSLCYLFKPSKHDMVEVYMKGFVDARGKLLLNNWTLNAAAQGLLSCWKAVVCAENKKLAWFVQHRSRPRLEDLSTISVASSSTAGSREDLSASRSKRNSVILNCSMCQKAVKLFHSLAVCAVCTKAVCSRCSVSRLLTDLSNQPIKICKACLTQAGRVNTFKLARQEVLSNNVPSVDPPTAPRNAVSGRSPSFIALEHSGDNLLAVSNRKEGEDGISTDQLSPKYEEVEEVSDDETHAIVPVNAGQIMKRTSESEQDFKSTCARVAARKQELLQQMAQLQIAAESVYQYTKHNTDLLKQHCSTAPSSLASTMSLFEDDYLELD